MGNGMKTIVTLNDQGKLTIPDAMRKALHLAAGDQLELEIQGGELILRPVLVVLREDAWAYMPEHRAHVREAQAQPSFSVTRDELAMIADAEDLAAVAEQVIAAHTNG